MNEQNTLTMTHSDFQNISVLLKNARPEIAEPLEEELSRATIVPDERLPDDVVAMNSKVVFQDVETGKESSVTLVYPQDANVDENKISILAPIGSALIGLRVGQIIQWPLPNGKNKKIRVVSVAGDNS